MFTYSGAIGDVEVYVFRFSGELKKTQIPFKCCELVENAKIWFKRKVEILLHSVYLT